MFTPFSNKLVTLHHPCLNHLPQAAPSPCPFRWETGWMCVCVLVSHWCLSMTRFTEEQDVSAVVRSSSHPDCGDSDGLKRSQRHSLASLRSEVTYITLIHSMLCSSPCRLRLTPFNKHHFPQARGFNIHQFDRLTPVQCQAVRMDREDGVIFRQQRWKFKCGWIRKKLTLNLTKTFHYRVQRAR